jgi:hypothetical protein
MEAVGPATGLRTSNAQGSQISQLTAWMVKDGSDTDFTFIRFPALSAQLKVYDCVHNINNNTYNVTASGRRDA